MSEWETGDTSFSDTADVSTDLSDVGPTDEIEYLGDIDGDVIDDTPEITDSIESDDIVDFEQDVPEVLENVEDPQLDTLDDGIDDISDIAEENIDPNSLDDVEYGELIEDIGDETENNDADIPDESIDEILGEEEQEMPEQLDEDAPKVLKRDETDAWRVGNSAIDDNVEAMRDDLRDKGWPDGPEMERMVAAEREKMEDEFSRTLAGDFTNPYMGPDFPEYSGEIIEEAIEDVSNGDTEVQDTIAEPSAYDRLNDYYSSHNYGRQHYSEYSKDPEWQALNNDYLTSLGRDPIDYESK